MRRYSRLIGLVCVVLLGLFAVVWSGAAGRAQDASSGQDDVSFGLVAMAQGVPVPSPADMLVLRIELGPGARSAGRSDPLDGLFVVQSGTLTVRLEAPWRVTRSGELEAARATAEAINALRPRTEAISSGQEVTLEAGDTAFLPGDVSGELRNDGQERVELLAFLVGPSTAPLTEATPES